VARPQGDLSGITTAEHFRSAPVGAAIWRPEVSHGGSGPGRPPGSGIPLGPRAVGLALPGRSQPALALGLADGSRSASWGDIGRVGSGQYPGRPIPSWAASGAIPLRQVRRRGHRLSGEGPIDLLLYSGWSIPIDCMDEEPSLALFQPAKLGLPAASVPTASDVSAHSRRKSDRLYRQALIVHERRFEPDRDHLHSHDLPAYTARDQRQRSVADALVELHGAF